MECLVYQAARSTGFRGTTHLQTRRSASYSTDKANHKPIAKVHLSTFYMDKTEVTYAAYQRCVKAGDCRRRRPAYNDYNRAKQPMVGVTWHEANQYCKAVGKHLPTEAEWEKAARGSDGQLYPWGDEPADCERP